MSEQRQAGRTVGKQGGHTHAHARAHTEMHMCVQDPPRRSIQESSTLLHVTSTTERHPSVQKKSQDFRMQGKEGVRTSGPRAADVMSCHVIPGQLMSCQPTKESAGSAPVISISSPGLASQRKLEQMPFLAGSSACRSGHQ